MTYAKLRGLGSTLEHTQSAHTLWIPRFTYTLQIRSLSRTLYTSRLPLARLTQTQRAIQRVCPLWDARVSLAQVLHQVQLLRAWRGGPFNMIAAARHGARCGLHAAQAEAAALELAHRARLVGSSAAARENCGTHACERRELHESRAGRPRVRQADRPAQGRTTSAS